MTEETDRSMLPSRLPMGRWPLWARWATIALCLVLYLIVPMAPTLLLPPDLDNGWRVFLEKSIILVLPLLGALALSRPIGPRALGIPGGRWRSIIAWALAGAVLLNVVSWIWDRVMQSPPTGTQLDQFGLGLGVRTDVLLILAITVVAPVGEEFLYRGLLHRAVRDATRRLVPAPVAIGLATVASTALFVSIHGAPEQQTMAWVYVVFGLVTALVYEATGSLLAPVLVHSATNAYAVASGALDGAGRGLTSSWLLALVVAAPLVALGLTAVVGRLVGAVGGERGEVRDSAP